MGQNDIPSNADSGDSSTNGVVGRLGGVSNALQPANSRLGDILNAYNAQPPPVNDKPTLKAALDQVQSQLTELQSTVNSLARLFVT
jgi:hypothetical protein